nr:phospholipid hydroperoxide glutathione peroxidase-like [Procambarus clarkii]
MAYDLVHSIEVCLLHCLKTQSFLAVSGSAFVAAYTRPLVMVSKNLLYGLCILAFPCNQFGGQEPGTEEEIKKFAQGYGVKFDMFSKVKVNGNDAHPLWNFLKSKQGGTLGNFIKWNFTKFLIDKEGNPVSRYSPQTNPIPAIEKYLQNYL